MAISEKTIVAKGKPKHVDYISRTNQITHYYVLNVNDNNYFFWIIRGALDIIESNDSIQNVFTSMKDGDTLQVKFRPSERDGGEKISVIGLTINKNVLIDAEKVKAQDSKWYYIKLVLSILAFSGWIFWKAINRPHTI